MYGGNFYGAPYSSQCYEDQAVSVITTTDASDYTSQEHPSHFATPPSAGHEGDTTDVYLDMEALEAKTKQLSMDSAYTSEVDLDSSHNTNSHCGMYSDGSAENSAPSSPKQQTKDTQSNHTSQQEQRTTPPPAGNSREGRG